MYVRCLHYIGQRITPLHEKLWQTPSMENSKSCNLTALMSTLEFKPVSEIFENFEGDLYGRQSQWKITKIVENQQNTICGNYRSSLVKPDL